MNDILFERVLKCRGDLLDDLDRTFDGNDLVSLQIFEQVNAIDVFHGDVKIAVRLAGIVDRDDMGVFELSRRLGFGFESANENRLLALSRGRTFNATVFFKSTFLARYTVPIPPWPILRSIKYLPSDFNG
jgi:hypothetical protein